MSKILLLQLEMTTIRNPHFQAALTAMRLESVQGADGRWL